jgi:phosphoribosylamine-glycine ligase
MTFNPSLFDGANVWLLKPTGLNQGRGIYILDNLEKIKSLIKELSEGIVIKGNGCPPPG